MSETGLRAGDGGNRGRHPFTGGRQEGGEELESPVDEQPTLPAAVRASLPPVVQAYVTFLESQLALLRNQVATLQATITKPGADGRPPGARPPELRELLSSPSSDPPSAAVPGRPKRPLSGRASSLACRQRCQRQ